MCAYSFLLGRDPFAGASSSFSSLVVLPPVRFLSSFIWGDPPSAGSPRSLLSVLPETYLIPVSPCSGVSEYSLAFTSSWSGSLGHGLSSSSVVLSSSSSLSSRSTILSPPMVTGTLILLILLGFHGFSIRFSLCLFLGSVFLHMDLCPSPL